MFLKFIKNENFLLFILLISSFLFNYYSGNRGVQVMDSFGFFDSGLRVSSGEYPIKDYWIPSGLTLDYFQGFLFSLFGISWLVYLIHSSLINFLVVILSFNIFKNLGLEKKLNFFFCVSISILAYPISGTPFVDHHATFLSLVAVYFLIAAITREKLMYWALLPPFFLLAFLSKQIPTTYIFLFSLVIIFYHLIFLTNNETKRILYTLLFSSLTSLALVSTIFYLSGIKIENFLLQYIYFPISIGEERYSDYTIDFFRILGNFKFIHFSIMPIVFMLFYKLYTIKNFYKKNNFKIFLICIFLYLILIGNQTLTMNQNYIFFLIPIFFAFSTIEISKFKFKKKKQLILIIVFITLFSTIKYFERFSVDRKFHELQDVDLSLSINAKEIDPILSGLNWITQDFKTNPREEIDQIINTINQLKLEDKKIMLLTNYSFISSVTKVHLNQPIRWYPMQGTAFPVSKKNKYYKEFQSYLIGKIKDKKIEIIYSTYDVPITFLPRYVNMNCLEEKKVNNFLRKYIVKADCDLY